MAREVLTKKSTEDLLAGLALAGVLTPIGTTKSALGTRQEQAVRQVLVQLLDRTDCPLTLGPIVVVGSNAIADWYQGEKGGRALLLKMHGEWAVRLLSGESLKDATMLSRIGIAKADALQLARDLADAEAKLEPTTRARFEMAEEVLAKEKPK